MAQKDEFDLSPEELAQAGSSAVQDSEFDLTPDELVDAELESPNRMNAEQAFMQGAGQGLTLGFGDEAGGAIEGGLDAAMSALNKLGLSGMSPSQVNAATQSIGPDGKPMPTSVLDQYKSGRDDARRLVTKAAEDQPTANFAGNVAGGLLLGGGAGIAAKAASPLVSGAGQVAQKVMSPLGNAAKGAPLVSRMATGAANAIPTGLIAGAGMSEADATSGKLEDLGKLGTDVLQGGVVAGGVGATLPLIGAGLKGTINTAKKLPNLIPDSIKTPFKRGAQGVDMKDPALAENVSKQLDDAAGELSAPLSVEKAAQEAKDADLKNYFNATINEADTNLDGKMRIAKTAADKTKLEEITRNDKLVEELASQYKVSKAEMKAALKERTSAVDAEIRQTAEKMRSVSATEKARISGETQKKVQETTAKLKSLEDDVKRGLEDQRMQQTNQNAEVGKELNNKVVETAKTVQKKVADLKESLGKDFDQIESVADGLNIKPDNRGIIGQMGQDLELTSGLPASEVKAIMKKVAPSFGKDTIQDHKNLKTTLKAYFGHNNPQVRKAAKQAYGRLNDQYYTALEANGEKALAKAMKETNQRWSAAMSLEEAFLDGTQNNRITGEMYAQPATIDTMAAIGGKTPKQIAKAQEFGDTMRVLDPAGTDPMLGGLKTLQQQIEEAANFKPNVPTMDDALASNPEAKRLQDLITQSKGQAKPSLDAALNAHPEYNALKQQLSMLKTAKAAGRQVPDETMVEMQKKVSQIEQDLAGAKSQKVEGTMGRLNRDPEYQALGDTRKTLRTFKNGIPETPEEMGKLRSLITESLGEDAGKQFDEMVTKNGVKPDDILAQFRKNPEGLKDQVRNLIKKFDRGGPDDNSEQKMKRLLDWTEGQGRPVDREKLSTLADDVYVRDQRGNKIPTLSNQAGVGFKGMKDGVKANVEAVTNSTPVKDAKKMLTKGIGKLAGASEQDIGEFARRLRTKGTSGEMYAKMLEDIAGKPSQTKNALMFGLMQQPEFRQLFKETNDNDEFDVDPELGF